MAQQEENPLKDALQQVLEAFSFEGTLADTKVENIQADSDEEALEKVLEGIKGSIHKLNDMAQNLAREGGINLQEVQKSLDNKDSYTQGQWEAIDYFKKQLRHWEKDMAQLLTQAPKVAQTMAKLNVEPPKPSKKKVTKKGRKKRRKIKSRSKWLSA